MIEKINIFLSQAKSVFSNLQDLLSVSGGLYVDAFAVVFIVRLLAPLKGYPALNYSEAGMWAATIAGFSYSKGGPRQS